MADRLWPETASHHLRQAPGSWQQPNGRLRKSKQTDGSRKTPRSPSLKPDKVITIKTDVYALEIDTEGGTLRNLDLLQYPHEIENTYVNKAYALIGMQAPERNLSPVRLFDSNPEHLFLAQSGLVASGDSASAPDHHAQFSSDKTSYELQAGQDELSVPLTWTNQQGLSITKTFTFKRGSYVIDVAQKVSNQTDKPWSGSIQPVIAH
jgi:YidC/Oxa1 family membrane protein insertase